MSWDVDFIREPWGRLAPACTESVQLQHVVQHLRYRLVELRRDLLLAVIERLGRDGPEVWARLHGRICLDRLTAPDGQTGEAVAS